jgi:tetratricopeptide (TPR) repeat protein
MKQGKGFRVPPKASRPAPPPQTLQKALTLHQQGAFAEAKRLYEEILKHNPAHFDALHLSGLLAYQTSRLAEAEGLFRKAISIKPTFAPVHSNFGLALHDMNRFDDAVASYDRAITLNPDDAEALSNRGLALQALKRFDDALASFDKAIAIQPGYALAWSNRGLALRDLKRPDAALASFDRAIALSPAHYEAWLNRGLALQDLARMGEALASYEKAIALKPADASAWSNMGNILKDLKRLPDAIACYDKAISVKPDYPDAWSNRGLALQELKRPAEALESYDRAIALKPDHAEAYSNRGMALQDLNRLHDALASYDKAISINPDHVEAWSNRGLSNKALRRFDMALADCDRAISIKADHFEVQWNKSLILLLTGQFAEGWRLYEARKAKKERSGHLAFNKPLWLGEEDLRGKTILAHREQGMGDTIQFCRYLARLNDAGARVLFAPPRQLRALMRSLDAAFDIVDENDQTLAFDYHAPLLSLPLAFRTDLSSLPAAVPYLKAEQDRIEPWRKKIGQDGFRIGVCWQGSTGKIDAGRSFPVSQFEALSRIPGVRLISLHKGEGEAQLHDLPQGMKLETRGDDFDAGADAFLDTAAVMACCDLVISSDTAVAHLAGALGVRTWVALQYVPDWRWLMERDDCPWYPTMRLFRQTTDGDWTGVFEAIGQALVQELGRALKDGARG